MSFSVHREIYKTTLYDCNLEMNKKSITTLRISLYVNKGNEHLIIYAIALYVTHAIFHPSWTPYTENYAVLFCFKVSR